MRRGVASSPSRTRVHRLLEGSLLSYISQGSTETLWAPVSLGTLDKLHALSIATFKNGVSPFDRVRKGWLVNRDTQNIACTLENDAEGLADTFPV